MQEKSGKYGYIVWLIASLFVVYAFALNTAAAAFSPAIQAALQTSQLGVSLAMGTFVLGFALMQIPAGYMLDKFNTKWIVSLGVLLLTLGNFVISYSNNLLSFSLSNFLQGVGASFAFISAAIIISQWFSPKQFPILFGFTQTLSCLFAGISHYYFAVKLQIQTWNEIYRELAAFGIILFVLAGILIKMPVHYSNNPISLRESLVKILKDKQILLCSFAAATSFGVLLAYASMWYLEVQKFYQVNAIESVFISGMIFVGIGIGTPLLGWISNKMHSRIKVIHVTLCLGVMALLLGLYLPKFAIPTLLITQIVSFLIGFFLSGSMLFYTLVSEIADNNTRGVAISVLNTAVFLFNTALLFLPFVFITAFSKEFFTYLWVLPFFIIFAILLLPFIQDSFHPTEGESKCLKQ